MKTKTELDRDILFITMRIRKDFPELLKFLQETPIHFSEDKDKGIPKSNQLDYYNSLSELVGKYSKEQAKMAESKKPETRKDEDLQGGGSGKDLDVSDA
jgi:hypothetical protein